MLILSKTQPFLPFVIKKPVSDILCLLLSLSQVTSSSGCTGWQWVSISDKALSLSSLKVKYKIEEFLNSGCLSFSLLIKVNKKWNSFWCTVVFIVFLSCTTTEHCFSLLMRQDSPVYRFDTLALRLDEVHLCILKQQSQRKAWHKPVLFPQLSFKDLKELFCLF